MTSKTRLLANLITNTGDVKSAGLDNAGGGGATSYANAAALPTSGNTAGDLAFTLDKKALFNWDGSEWDRVYSGPNETLTWDSALSTSTPLNLDGSEQVIHVAAAADAEGFPIEYNFSLSPTSPVQLDSNFTIIDSANGNFTIKPTTTLARAGTFQFRATATDGTHVISTTTTAKLAFSFIEDGVAASSALITVNGSETWRYHLFDSSSAFTVTEDIDSAEYLMIGGGGGGGSNGGGGGGAGGFLKGSVALPTGSYTYTVGAFGVYNGVGAGSDNMAANWTGGNTTLTDGGSLNLTAYGGGGGGARTGTSPYVESRGAAGGSSGGNAGSDGTASLPRAPLVSGAQGNAGGDDGSSGVNGAGGGGGGAGGAGGNGAYRLGGSGGAGVQDNFTGTLTYYSAGGAGFRTVNGSGGQPGTGHDSASYGMGGPGGGIAGHGPATNGVLMIRYKLAG